MLRLVCAHVCVLMLLGLGEAQGRETVERLSVDCRAAALSTCTGMCLYSRVGQGAAVHRPLVVPGQSEAAEGAGEARESGDELGGIAMRQNRPNPFNPVTVIEYAAGNGGRARLVIYNSSGRLVRTLIDETFTGDGRGLIAWDGTGDDGDPLCSGVYFARLEAAGEAVTRKMVLLK